MVIPEQPCGLDLLYSPWHNPALSKQSSFPRLLYLLLVTSQVGCLLHKLGVMENEGAVGAALRSLCLILGMGYESFYDLCFGHHQP